MCKSTAEKLFAMHIKELADELMIEIKRGHAFGFETVLFFSADSDRITTTFYAGHDTHMTVRVTKAKEVN